MKKERKIGESIKNWKDRIIWGNNNGIYGGELEPSVIRADTSSISSNKRTLGSKSNDHRVNQNSLIQRKYRENQSIGEKLFNSVTDVLHITTPPTFIDGYGRQLNAEVPLSESAQGQELRRIGNTAGNAATITMFGTLPFSLYTAPLATTAGLTAGIGTASATNGIMNLIENGSNFKFSPGQRNTVALISSIPTGIKAYKWGWNSEKRAIETAMNLSGGSSSPLGVIKQGIIDYPKKDLFKYIFTGKGRTPSEVIPTIKSGDPAYSGSGSKGWGANPGESSMVRAFLYDEPIPELHQVEGYGVHDDYIVQNYPHKYGKIKVYEGNPKEMTNLATEDVAPMIQQGTSGDITFRKPNGDLFTVDAGGHIVETGIGENGLYTREQDIWKYNPKDWRQRWMSPMKKKPLYDWGLNFVDSHGTPVVTRTTWHRESIPQSLIEQDPNDVAFNMKFSKYHGGDGDIDFIKFKQASINKFLNKLKEQKFNPDNYNTIKPISDIPISR